MAGFFSERSISNQWTAGRKDYSPDSASELGPGEGTQRRITLDGVRFPIETKLLPCQVFGQKPPKLLLVEVVEL